MVAYVNTREKADVYRQQNVLTASPGELTLMLYDGCIRNIKMARLYLESRDIAKSNDTLLKAQAILAELHRTLDMQYEVSQGLANIYQFLLSELRECNIKKDPGKTVAVLEILTDLRDTWQEAIRLNRQQNLSVGSSI